MAFNANHELRKLHRDEDRLADKITGFAGSLRFVRIHLAWFAAWIVTNTVVLEADQRFDPYPFGLLTLIVSLEAIILTSFVMVSQNRQAQFSEARAELDYRTDLIAEREITLIMRALDRIAKHHGIDVDDLVLELGALRAQSDGSVHHDKAPETEDRRGKRDSGSLLSAHTGGSNGDGAGQRR